MNFIQKKINLKNRWSLVTGSCGYLGSKIVHSLAELGSNIIILDLDKAKCDKLKNLISRKYKVRVLSHTCNLELESERIKFIKFLDSKIKKLDIFINNASMVGSNSSVGWSAKFEKQSLESWRKSIEINLTSAFHLTQGLLKLLKKSNKASIVNISSIYGIYAPDMNLYSGTNINNPAGYSVSKAGLIQLTKWLSTTLSPSIRVNSIAPGGILRNQGKKFVQKYANGTPLKRMAKEEDIIGGVIFLSTSLSNYITGQVLVIDGGRGVW